MRYCLIGCGRVAPEHLRAALHNKLEIVGLCDIDPRRMNEHLAFAKNQLQGVPVYTNYHEMLAEQKPELVAIATPSGLHAQMALDCLAVGAHVIIEKPVAMTMEDAKRVADCAKQRGLTAACSLQNRFNPAVMALKAAVDAGRFGRIYSAAMHLRWYRDDVYYQNDAWRGTRALDGGVMMNQGIHGIDLLNWMLGEPQEVKAITARLAHNIEMEDLALAAVRYESGALAQISCETVRYHGAEEEILELSGEHGCVRLGGHCAHLVQLWRFDAAAPNEEETMRRDYSSEPTSVYGHGHSMCYADVLAAIAEGRPPLVDMREAARALRVVLESYESAMLNEK